MSYTYKIVYELTERLTDDQLAAMKRVLDKPWTPPPGYSGEVVNAFIRRYHCDTDNCSECLECEPVDRVPDVSICYRSSDCILTHNHHGDCELRYP